MACNNVSRRDWSASEMIARNAMPCYERREELPEMMPRSYLRV
jgi:hypothetical protein